MGTLRHAKRDEYVVILGAAGIDERRLTYNMVLAAGRPAVRVLDASILSAGPGGPTVLTFTGSGWGHGVGMSQYGARELAERGHSYPYILTYYYSGVQLSQSYGR